MKNKNTKPTFSLKVSRQSLAERGYRIVDVLAHDRFEKEHAHVRKKITQEIENEFIPEISAYIDSRGHEYTRGEPNPVSDRLYSKSPVLERWKNQMPKAEALYPLQKPEKQMLSDGTSFDDIAAEYFMHVLDGVGLRSRASVMSKIMHDHFVEHRQEKIEWLSLACGAAVPVFDAATELKKQGKNITIKLADISGKALKFAEKLAGTDYDLTENIETVKLNILRLRKMRRKLGKESYDAIDILGFFEYIPSQKWKYKPGITFPGAVQFLKTSYSLLRQGGILVFGNMSDQHPQLKFTTGVVQWPFIQPRSIEEIADIIEAAEIPLDHVDIFRIHDKVYYVIAIYK